MQIILNQLIFFLTIVWLFFVPGMIFLRAFMRKTKLSTLEFFVAGFGIGVILLNFLLITLNKTFDLPLTRTTILLIPLIIITSCILLPSFRKPFSSTNTVCCKRKSLSKIRKLFSWITNKRIFLCAFRLCKSSAPQDDNQKNKQNTRVTAIATLLIMLTIIIKAFYLSDTIFPTATDMGHHLYWVNKIAQTHQLQSYEKQKVVFDSDTYTMSAPEPIPDFIIGEHIPLAAIQIVTGQDILSPEPVLFLFLFDILSLLALFVLALRFFARTHYAQYIGLAVLFLMGPIYTISASQAKFISGGVIGNLFGNLFIPLALFFLYRALSEKSPRFLSLFFITAIGLVYTHHLSTFILAYVVAFTVGIFAILNIRTLITYIISWFKLLFTPITLITLTAIVLFILFVHVPSYLNTDAITSATGAPSKDTRTGVALPQLIHTIGEARFAFALIGISIVTLWIIITKSRRLQRFFDKNNLKKIFIMPTQNTRQYTIAFLLAWPLAIFAMSTIPQYLGVNIISSRIANYTIIPFALIGGVGLTWLITLSRTYLHGAFAGITIVLLLLFPLTTGMYDNNQSLKTVPNITQAQESFAAAHYLAQHATPDVWTVKDHNYLTADTWMKLFFLRDYSYPLSRSFFKRYESGKRETCTRDMISTPLSPDAQRCFGDLNVQYIIVHPSHDSAQFMKSEQFSRIYSSNTVTIFYKKQP